MNCQNCQTQLLPNAQFCGNCGAQVANPAPAVSAAPQQQSVNPSVAPQQPSSQPVAPQPFASSAAVPMPVNGVGQASVAQQPMGQQPAMQPQQQFQNQFAPQNAEIKNYRMPAVIVTITCSLLFGIIALLYSDKVDKALKAGDVAVAQANSKKAKTWIIVAIAVGLPITILSILAQLSA